MSRLGLIAAMEKGPAALRDELNLIFAELHLDKFRAEVRSRYCYVLFTKGDAEGSKTASILKMRVDDMWPSELAATLADWISRKEM